MSLPRYGIFSASSIAPRFLEGVRQSGAGEILSLYSRSLDKARAKAKEWKIPFATDDAELFFSDPAIDTVYISSVNSLHYAHAKAAIAAGKHVILEKPFTTCPEHTEELFSLARQKGVFIMEAQKMLFLPAVKKAKALIENGAVGKIRFLSLAHSFRASYNSWLLDPALGGGTLLSAGIYAVELLLWLCGEPRSLHAHLSLSETGGEEQYLITGETKDGALFSFANSAKVPLVNTALLCGDKGRLELPSYWKADTLIHTDADGAPVTLRYPCAHELSYEAAHVAQCLSQGLLTSPVVTPELTLESIRLIDTLKHSLR